MSIFPAFDHFALVIDKFDAALAAVSPTSPDLRACGCAEPRSRAGAARMRAFLRSRARQPRHAVRPRGISRQVLHHGVRELEILLCQCHSEPSSARRHHRYQPLRYGPRNGRAGASSLWLAEPRAARDRHLRPAQSGDAPRHRSSLRHSAERRLPRHRLASAHLPTASCPISGFSSSFAAMTPGISGMPPQGAGWIVAHLTGPEDRSRLSVQIGAVEAVEAPRW